MKRPLITFILAFLIAPLLSMQETPKQESFKNKKAHLKKQNQNCLSNCLSPCCYVCCNRNPHNLHEKNAAPESIVERFFCMLRIWSCLPCCNTHIPFVDDQN